MQGDAHNKRRLKRQTGEVVSKAYTNNVIFDLAICKESGLRFDETMPLCGGTDNLFFRQMVNHEYKIVWNKQAFLFKQIDADRLSLIWLVRRHARHGVTFVHITKKLSKNKIHRISSYIGEFFHVLRDVFKKILTRQPRCMVTNIFIGIARCVGIIMAMIGMRVNEYKSRHQ